MSKRFRIFSNDEDGESLIFDANNRPVADTKVASLRDMASLLELSAAQRAELERDGYICYDRDGQAVIAEVVRWEQNLL